MTHDAYCVNNKEKFERLCLKKKTDPITAACVVLSFNFIPIKSDKVLLQHEGIRIEINVWIATK